MLVSCPECGARISERADPCPKCGLPDAGTNSKESMERYVQRSKEAIDREGGRKSYCTNCGQWWKFTSQIVEMYRKENGYHSRDSAKCPRCGKELKHFHRVEKS